MSKRVTGEEMAQQLSDFVNSANGAEIDKFVNEINSDHPELQNRVFNLFISTAKGFSNKQNYDARNQFAVETSKKIMDVI